MSSGSNSVLAVLPLLPSIYLLAHIDGMFTLSSIFTSVMVSVCAYLSVRSLIPVISVYTLKRGLSGKDLGKKGTPTESDDIPEALGLVCGVIYLLSAIILTQLLFTQTPEMQMTANSALFSVCFMVFLGFVDDCLDLKWRYKLILPPLASLPLLSAYNGHTALNVPKIFRHYLVTPLASSAAAAVKKYSSFPYTEITCAHTPLGAFINNFVIVDRRANGAIIELGNYFKLYMGLLAVFCTNAINIYAGINGLEAGQSYIIAASVCAFQLYEMKLINEETPTGIVGESQMFAVVMILPLIGVILGLLHYNWFPAKVFVGDTFCYFAGMTFAVIGIHGHFSKTLLCLFAPQVFNFIYSIPQLFKFLPCPRHRLPRVDPTTHLMTYSAFPCEAHEYRVFKVCATDTECPNCTLICLVLRVTGPLSERDLCVVLLALQSLCSVFVFLLKYVVLAR